MAVANGFVDLPSGSLPIVELVQASLGRLRGEVIGNGIMRREDMPDHPLGGDPAFYEFNCTAFEVEVDKETGEILMHKRVPLVATSKAEEVKRLILVSPPMRIGEFPTPDQPHRHW
jgi:hypothetical protein